MFQNTTKPYSLFIPPFHKRPITINSSKANNEVLDAISKMGHFHLYNLSFDAFAGEDFQTRSFFANYSRG
jgi:hypothetical protein